jgi:electron transport complex protein RnfC
MFGRRSFSHGIHPPGAKEATRGAAIEQFDFAPLLVVPLKQHAGPPAVPVVGEGQEVRRGQLIGRPEDWMSVGMHAPVSGIVKRIAPAPTITGHMAESVFIEPFAASTQEVMEGEPCRPDAAPEAILQAIQRAGIVGLGGAAFPTHAKLRVPPEASVDVVVVNGAECEPMLTTDHRVMLEQAADIFVGLRYVLGITSASRVVVGIEHDKADAAKVLREACPSDLPVEVQTLPVKYPQGAEKILIHTLLGREIPSGKLPFHVGALCINVATTAEIGRLLPHGRGIQERVVTVSGPAIKRKGNYRMPIGTPLRFVLETVGVTDDLTMVFMGGPMMGTAASSLDIPVVKGTSGVIAYTRRETGPVVTSAEQPCIRCGYCVQACPLDLNPCELGLLARAERFESMAKSLHLMDCFECGCCTYVCPSHIPLVQRFRVAKAALRRERTKS